MGFEGTSELLTEITAKVLKYATPFGYAWITVLYMFRLLPVETVGEPIFDGYDDEEEWFECTTEQPACRQQCFNRFHPISHSRLWEFQILIVSVPILIFSGVALSVTEKKSKLTKTATNYEEVAKRNLLDQNQFTHYMHIKEKLKDYTTVKKISYTDGKMESVVWNPVITYAYLGTTIMKLIIELISIYSVYQLQRVQNNADSGYDANGKEVGIIPFSEVWVIPQRYNCRLGVEEHSACAQDESLPCFVPRAHEKTLFMYYSLTMQIVSVVLLILDFIYVFRRSIIEEKNRKMMAEYQESVKDY